jgi:plastocyanin
VPVALRNRLALAGAVVLAAAALGACGSGSDSSSSGSSKTPEATSTPASTPAESTPSSGGAGSRLSLSADPEGQLKFDKARLRAKAGGVTIVMANPSSVPHAIAVEGNGVDEDGGTVGSGGTSTVEADLEPGTYTFYCPVGGHEDAGMRGTLTVN